jgi:hypothetical protein
LTTPAGDHEYEVWEGNSVAYDMTPTFSPALNAACVYTLDIEIKAEDGTLIGGWDTTGSGNTVEWVENTADTFTAAILNTDYASFSEPTDYTIKWHYSIDAAENGSTLTTDAYDYATLTMVDKCYYNSWSTST